VADARVMGHSARRLRRSTSDTAKSEDVERREEGEDEEAALGAFPFPFEEGSCEAEAPLSPRSLGRPSKKIQDIAKY